MQVTETVSKGLSREFQIVIPAGDLNDRLMKHLDSIKGQVKLKGFRPGKVPVSHLKKAYGKSLMGDIIQKAVNELSTQALEERDLRPAQTPKIDIEGEMDAIIEGKSDLTIKLAFELMPEFELSDLSKLKLERPVAQVTDEDMNAALDQLAEQQKVFKSREKTAKAIAGDQVTIDFVGTVDGEEFEGGKGEDLPLVLGSGSFLPGFEDQLVDSKVGDEVTVNVDFPPEYAVSTLAGKPATFSVIVKDVAASEKAKIDDNLAKGLGVDDLSKLQVMIKDRLERDFARVSRDRLKRNLLDRLDEVHDFELPGGMVQAEFDQIWAQLKADLENVGEEDAEKNEQETQAEYRGIAERRVKLGLILAEIGRSNNIDISQEDLGKALQHEVSHYPGQEKQIYDLYNNNPQMINRLRAPLFEDKVVDFILELADVSESKVNREELFKDPDEPSAEDAPKKAGSTRKTSATKNKKA